MAWKAIVYAKGTGTPAGFLLGGVKRTSSAPFLKRENAVAWLRQYLGTNQGAGRPCHGHVVEAPAARSRCADAYDETAEAARLRERMAAADAHMRRYGF